MAKGYKAGYAALKGDFTEISNSDDLKKLPKELAELLEKWVDYAKVHKDELTFPWYEKFASEIFRYKGINYKINPSLFPLSDAGFSHIMRRYVEDELVEIGAEEVFCNAMLD